MQGITLVFSFIRLRDVILTLFLVFKGCQAAGELTLERFAMDLFDLPDHAGRLWIRALYSIRRCGRVRRFRLIGSLSNAPVIL